MLTLHQSKLAQKQPIGGIQKVRGGEGKRGDGGEDRKGGEGKEAGSDAPSNPSHKPRPLTSSNNKVNTWRGLVVHMVNSRPAQAA